MSSMSCVITNTLTPRAQRDRSISATSRMWRKSSPLVGLIENEQLTSACQRRSDGDALLLTAGKRLRMPLRERQQIEPGKNLLRLRFIRCVHAQEHLLHHAFREKLVACLLHHHVGAMQPILRRQSLISPGDHAAALLKAAEAARESRFPRAVVTNNAADAPPLATSRDRCQAAPPPSLRVPFRG